MVEKAWYVAHTKPRCEKKLHDFCAREGIAATLPLVAAVHRYRGKTATFTKPLFPGYVFLHLLADQKPKVFQRDHVANLLHVFDQDLFGRQLAEILRALQGELDVFLAPEIGAGRRVRVKHGPLRGMEGCVENRYGPATVLLRLDFIGQAAAISIPAENLETL